MKRYSEYKDSGVKWIGEVPGHTNVVFLKRVSNIVLGKMLCNRPKVESDELGHYLCAKDIHFTGIDYSDLKQMFFSRAEKLTLRVRKGDLLVVEGGAGAGGSYVVEEDRDCFIQNSVLKVRTNSNCLPKYVWYNLFNLMSKGYIDYVCNKATIPHFTKEKLGSTPIIIYPLPEQRAIVAYLDDKVAKIDQYIAVAEQKMKALDELKQTIIADAVTHGINPNATMKDSGVKWIGRVPEHWERRRMKFLFREISEKGHPDEPCLCSTQKYGVIPQSMYENRVVVVNKGLGNLKFVRKGNFVISLRSFQGGIEMAHYQGIISAAYTILSLNSDCLDKMYVMRLFKSHQFILLLQSCVTGIREGQNINYELLRKHFLPIPPLPEQRAIVAYLDDKVAKIEQLRSREQAQIEKLKEYKQQLISDVVTGKVKVVSN